MTAERIKSQISEAPPIFIVGAPRSGTTLIGRMLGLHPDIVSPGETHFFEDIYGRRHLFGTLATRDNLERAAEHLMTALGRFRQRGQSIVDKALTTASLVVRTEALGGNYDGLYLAFLSLIAEAEGKTRFCDDTPRHLFSLPTILRFFPDAKIIGAVRDPRDFLSSYKHYWKVAAEADRIRALYHPVMTPLIWQSSAQVLARAHARLGPERIHLLRYESLTAAPEEAARGLCDFLGVEYSSDMLEVDKNNSSFDRGSSGIFTDSIGRWRETLAPEEVWWTQRLARRGMRAFDYEPATAVAPRRVRLAGQATTAPFALVRALLANAHRQGRPSEFLRRRIAALWGGS